MVNCARKSPFLARIQRPISPQIAPPTQYMIPEKITQQKDVRILILLRGRFCLYSRPWRRVRWIIIFISEIRRGDGCQTGSSSESPTENESGTDYNPSQVPACDPKYTARPPSHPDAPQPFLLLSFHIVKSRKCIQKSGQKLLVE